MPPLVSSCLRRSIRAAHLGLSLIGLWVLVALATPATVWYARCLAGHWPEPKGDVLIVLGGADWDDDFVGESTYLRCIYAVRAYKAGAFRRVVVSGGRTAIEMRNFLVYYGVPADSILVESRSRSTRENALFTRDMLAGEPGVKVIVTSDYHAYRAGRAFRRAGLDVVASPFPDAIKRSQRIAGRVPAFVLEAQETLKIAYYRARGWI